MSEPNKQSKTTLFRFSLIDDMTHRQLYVRKFTRSGFLVMVISTVVVVLASIYSIIAFTPLRKTIPGYPDAASKKNAVQNAIRIDSLEHVISRWAFYTDNLLNILENKATVSVDSLLRIADSEEFEVKDPEYLSSRDSLLRETVTSSQQFTLTDSKEREVPIEGMHFFNPLKGVITESFDAQFHPYVTIAGQKNSIVLAVLPGTVIYSDWSSEQGYVVMIQHDNDIVSVYKNNQKLLRKTGDKVTAGSSIALVSGTDSSNDKLVFELWYQGSPVDPEKYMNF